MREILNTYIILNSRMFTVKPMRNPLFLIDGVKNIVSVLFDCSRKDYNFIMLSHFVQELVTIRPYVKETLAALNFLCVDKSLVHIQDKSIDSFFWRWEEWWLRLGGQLVDRVGQDTIQRDQH